jgi:hypothetical protein
MVPVTVTTATSMLFPNTTNNTNGHWQEQESADEIGEGRAPPATEMAPSL